jgi:rhodanese-related sulfurtransferase
MGTVEASSMADAVVPAPYVRDYRADEHGIVARSRWHDIVTCSCGVLARADFEQRAWIGDGHVLPFGSREETFRSEEPDDVEQRDQASVTTTRRPGRGDIAAQVIAELGIDPASVLDGGEEPTQAE